MGLVLWTPNTFLGKLSAFWQSCRDSTTNPYSHAGVLILYEGTLYYTDSNYNACEFYQIEDVEAFFDTAVTIFWLGSELPAFLDSKIESSTNTSKLDLLRVAVGDTPKGDVCTTYAAKVFDIYDKEILTTRQLLLAVSKKREIVLITHVVPVQ